MKIPPAKTYTNPDDGNTYFLAPLEDGGDVVWACPTNADSSADFESAIPETDFAEPLDPEERRKIVAGLTPAKP